MNKNRFNFVLATAAAGILMMPAGAALASPSAPPAPAAGAGTALAEFQGRTIDLAKGWEGAKSCTVNGPADIECFATTAEADKKAGYNRKTDTLAVQAEAKGLAAAADLPSCAERYLCLYEHDKGGGRRLQFANEYWQNLDDYGFANTMSSWRNNSSNDQGSVFDNGGKGQLNISGKTYSSNIGTFWNDTADQVYG
ncbi:peptidase inhibitor family I36 protein [Actinoplanes sp. NPDC023936]|uniref:peptidase inhibitor family I36 protein n=1 Tax=Actinoplanes sp. NPDC023936 TaxID=3154910 RepID=UPI0034072FF7